MRCAAWLLLCAAVMAGCANPPSDPQGTTSATAAPFDPCTQVSDEAIRQAGFNPASRARIGASGEYLAGCAFTSASMTLQLAIVDVTFEKFRDRNAGRRIGTDIGPRPAVLVRLGSDRDSPCELGMKLGDRVLSFRSTLSVQAKEWGDGPMRALDRHRQSH